MSLDEISKEIRRLEKEADGFRLKGQSANRREALAKIAKLADEARKMSEQPARKVS